MALLRLRHAGVLVLLAAAAAAGAYSYSRLASPPRAPDVDGLLWPEPRRLGEFSLVDHDGAAFDLERLRGHWSLVFFGYTHCPDVCPLTLQTLAQVTQELRAGGAWGGDDRVVFVSVDPQRDTPEHLARYVGYFDPDFVGVTGPPERLRVLTRQLGVVARKGEPAADGGYLVDHTAAVLLLDPQARLVGLLRAPHEAGDLAARIATIREFVAGT